MAATLEMLSSIKFGTDGWRGIIADDFTIANVRLVARAVAGYLEARQDTARPLMVGYDCRFLSGRFALAAAEEIAASGIPVRLATSYTPTPALSFMVRHKQACGGVMITASHNPWQWNGFKFKASYGGSAGPEIIKQIEAEIPRAASTAPSTHAQTVEREDMVQPYFEHLESVIDLNSIAERNYLFVLDPMYGAARGYFRRFLEEKEIRCQEIHGEANPLFGGMNPEPIDPHIGGLRSAVRAAHADVGFATDGDADRIGAIDRSGELIDSHKIFSILLRYLVEVRGMKGAVAKTFSATKMLDKLAAKYSMRLFETPVGFKYISDLILENEIVIGGEESGGIGIPALGGPERDGILNSLVLAEAMAYYGKSLGEMVADLESEFGPHRYGRIDCELRPGQKEDAMGAVARDGLSEFAGFPITRRENLDGIKMYFENGAWLLLRPSGTEPLLRLYCEAASQDIVNDVLVKAEAFVRGR